MVQGSVLNVLLGILFLQGLGTHLEAGLAIFKQCLDKYGLTLARSKSQPWA